MAVASSRTTLKVAQARRSRWYRTDAIAPSRQMIVIRCGIWLSRPKPVGRSKVLAQAALDDLAVVTVDLVLPTCS